MPRLRFFYTPCRGLFDPDFQGDAGQRRGGASLKIQGGASLKIHGGASSLAYVIIICNDVTRASLDEIGQNLLTTHFLASLRVCDTIEGLRLAYYALLLGTETS